jgi:hypothetical protein
MTFRDLYPYEVVLTQQLSTAGGNDKYFPLQRIARSCSQDVMDIVQGVFLDFVPFSALLFSFNISKVTDLRIVHPRNLIACIAERLFATIRPLFDCRITKRKKGLSGKMLTYLRRDRTQ